MFGSQYQQAVVDENRLRQEQARTGGLTGWAAITDAMSSIGSEIGYSGGQAMGMLTPAQQQNQRFDSVMASMPDFDMTDPEQAKLMSSKMYAEGFYDDAMTLLKESQEMQKVDALMKYYEDIGSGANKAPITNKRDSGVSAAELAISLDLVKKNFKDSFFDFVDPDLPAGSSEEGLSLFIAQTARNTNNSMDEVISLIKSGQLKISQGTTAASTTPAGGADLNLDPTTTLIKR